MVDRIPDARDRRRTLVWLTDYGLAMLDRCNQVLDVALLESCIKEMSQQDVMRLEAGMEALLKAAEDISNDIRRKI